MISLTTKSQVRIETFIYGCLYIPIWPYQITLEDKLGRICLVPRIKDKS